MLRVAGDENTRQCSGDRKLLRLRQRRVVRSLCDLPRRHRQRRGEDEMTELHTGKTFLLEDGMTCRERKRSVSIADIPSVTKLVALQGDNSPARPRHPRHDATRSPAQPRSTRECMALRIALSGNAFYREADASSCLSCCARQTAFHSPAQSFTLITRQAGGRSVIRELVRRSTAG